MDSGQRGKGRQEDRQEEPESLGLICWRIQCGGRIAGDQELKCVIRKTPSLRIEYFSVKIGDSFSDEKIQ